MNIGTFSFQGASVLFENKVCSEPKSQAGCLVQVCIRRQSLLHECCAQKGIVTTLRTAQPVRLRFSQNFSRHRSLKHLLRQRVPLLWEVHSSDPSDASSWRSQKSDSRMHLDTKGRHFSILNQGCTLGADTKAFFASMHFNPSLRHGHMRYSWSWIQQANIGTEHLTTPCGTFHILSGLC